MKIRQEAPDISGIRDDHVLRYKFVVGSIATLGLKGKILDAGCGVGYGSHMLSKSFGVKVTGIDISAEAIAYAKRYYPCDAVEFEIFDIGGLTPYQFETIIMFEVIEHTDAAPRFLERASKYSKYLFGSVPNENVVPFIPGKANPEHYRHYTPDEITEELEQAGWEIMIMGSQKGKLGKDAVIDIANPHGHTIVFMAKGINHA